MKHIFISILLALPVFSFAQHGHAGTVKKNDPTIYSINRLNGFPITTTDDVDKPLLTTYNWNGVSYGGTFISTNSNGSGVMWYTGTVVTNSFVVKGVDGKVIMQVSDTSPIKVYGDTLSVLKAIVKYYDIKQKQ